MHESLIRVSEDYIFLRHNSILPGRATLLFVHGLGDSGLSFQEVFEDDNFDRFNLLVPDLTGYGRSSRSNDYSFDAHLNRLWFLIEQMESQERTEMGELTVIGHSLGGDLLTLFCDSARERRVRRFVNIEGNLTQSDLFISSQAAEAANRGEFMQWFSESFADSTVYNEWGRQHESCRRYYASLRFARPEAFLANSRELRERNTSIQGKYQSAIGKIYCDLPMTKVYCAGSKSISPETIRFIHANGLDCKLFADAFHWPMIDNDREFYSFLLGFVSGD